MSGNAARANARWGFLKAPFGTGKLLWIVSDANINSVRLGAELTQAIRQKRLDVRLALTFEHEYPDQLQALLSLEKTGLGYTSCDHPLAVQRVLQRLNPFAVIFTGAPPKPNLSRALSAVRHTMVVAAANEHHVDAKFEHVYPATESQAQTWHSSVVSPVVDFFSLLSAGQVDPNFKSLVNGSQERRLWWLHCSDSKRARSFIGQFRSQFCHDVLFVSGVNELDETINIKTWARTPLPPGALVWVDELKWLPAIAASVQAVHFTDFNSALFWQAMGGGGAVSCSAEVCLPKKNLIDAVEILRSSSAILETWQVYCNNPILMRSRADAARRRFWEERRLASTLNATLLQTIFDWD